MYMQVTEVFKNAPNHTLLECWAFFFSVGSTMNNPACWVNNINNINQLLVKFYPTVGNLLISYSTLVITYPLVGRTVG